MSDGKMFELLADVTEVALKAAMLHTEHMRSCENRTKHVVVIAIVRLPTTTYT